MTTQKYLEEILGQQTLSDDSNEIKAIQSEREKIEKILKTKYNKTSPTIRYGGSKAKGTMIKESYDLDIVCYFNRDDSQAGDSLPEIYNSVKNALESAYLVVPKTSALRLEHSDEENKGVYFHIDVVPGRFVDDKKEDAFLHQASGDEGRLKTNLQIQIDHVKNSKLQDVIKLLKYWKIKNGLSQVKTFILELLIIKTLEKCDKSKLDACLQKFWEIMRDGINDMTIEDPANPEGNDLSKLFNANVKNVLSFTSLRTLKLVEQEKWEDIFGPVAKMSDDEIIEAIKITKSQTVGAAKPWSDYA
jgi:hypothetical protein